MKKSIKDIQGGFLLLLCATLLVSFTNKDEESQILNEKVAVLSEQASVGVHAEGCPECEVAFKECSAVPEKKFTDEVERISDEFKAGKIKREEKDKAFEVAKATFIKVSSECGTTFTKCCLEEVRKAKAASKAKS
nr:hypothetical protein [uncultured Flavobacterium sp.]